MAEGGCICTWSLIKARMITFEITACVCPSVPLCLLNLHGVWTFLQAWNSSSRKWGCGVSSLLLLCHIVWPLMSCTWGDYHCGMTLSISFRCLAFHRKLSRTQAARKILCHQQSLLGDQMPFADYLRGRRTSWSIFLFQGIFMGFTYDLRHSKI